VVVVVVVVRGRGRGRSDDGREKRGGKQQQMGGSVKEDEREGGRLLGGRVWEGPGVSNRP
jgi:hypothetical protein